MEQLWDVQLKATSKFSNLTLQMSQIVEEYVDRENEGYEACGSML